jgi:hypothetical protein
MDLGFFYKRVVKYYADFQGYFRRIDAICLPVFKIDLWYTSFSFAYHRLKGPFTIVEKGLYANINLNLYK